MLEKKLSQIKISECVCGLNENNLPNHLSKVLEQNYCYDSRAPKYCEYSIVIDRIKICRYL